ncbi:MAG: hypothetical protein ACRC7O_18985 [Fimbriiglobus sp.]
MPKPEFVYVVKWKPFPEMARVVRYSYRNEGEKKNGHVVMDRGRIHWIPAGFKVVFEFSLEAAVKAYRGMVREHMNAAARVTEAGAVLLAGVPEIQSVPRG